MTKLEELINELCPDGVEYVKIKDYFIRLKGTPITAAKMKEIASNDGEIKVFAGGKTVINAYEKDIPKANITRVPAVLVQSRGVIDVVYYDEPFTFKNEMWAYTHNEQTTVKYLFYFLSTQVNKMRESASGMGSLPQISLKVTEEMQIPLPPLSIQSEIVHILDSFTLLTAELTAELTARQKQYAFYRDYLLDFSNEDITKKIPDIDCSNVEYKRLGEVCNVQSGGTPSKKESEYWNGGTIPWLASTVCKNKKSVEEVTNYITEKGLKNSSAKMMKEKTTLIALVGATIGKIAFLPFEASINQNVAGLFPVDENIINADYLFYACSTLYSKFQNLGNGKLAMANMSFVRNLVIPVPPLSVQENIVKILDRFDKLNNDMSEGLPAEIEARKKQYEYYRDTLLSFDDTACSHIVKVERERELTRIKAIKWLKLKEIAHYSTDRIDSSKLDENTYVGVDNLLQNRTGKKLAEHIPTSGRYTKYMCNDILIGNIRPYLKKIWFANNDGGTNGDVLDIRVNDYSVLYPRYLYYVLSSDKFFNYDMQNAKGAKMPRGSKDAVMNYPIPVPTLEEQERIVSILDRFDKLCNDISEGLPAEIEARQKQYEYYRDKLLTFKITN